MAQKQREFVRFEDVLNAVKKAVEEGDVQGRSWAEIAAVKIAIDQTGGAKAVGEIVAILRKFEPKLQKMGIGNSQVLSQPRPSRQPQPLP